MTLSHHVLLFLLQIAVTLYMTGLIWFVQVVHYPLFDGVGLEHFVLYENRHTSLTTLVVAAPMLIEICLALWLVLFPLPPEDPWAKPLAWTGLGLAALLWFVTAFVSVPQHRVLSEGFDTRAHQILVLSNWLRTFGWTARSVLLLTLLGRWLGPLVK